MRRVVLAIILCARGAGADSSVTVTLNAQGQQLATQIGASVPDLIQHTQDQINGLFQLLELGQLLRSFANTAAFADRGLGVDYQPDAGDLMVGVAAVGALSTDATLGTSNPALDGAVANIAITVGTNLARWDHARWTVFANGFYESSSIHGLDGHLLTSGGHVQYRILQATQPARVQWTGLDVTSGVEYARWAIGIASTLTTHFTVTGTTDHATVDMASTGTLSVLASTVTIPIEVTTGVRFFDTLGAYAGGGLDLTTGTSTINAALNGVLTIDEGLPIGTATVTASGASSPSPITVHALAGLQLHTKHVRVFLQGEIAPGELSAGLGLRLVR